MRILLVMTPAFNPNNGGVQRTTYKLGQYFTEQGLDVYYCSLKHTGHIEAEYGQLFHPKESGGITNTSNVDWLKNTLHHIKPDIVINQMPYEVTLRSTLHTEKQSLKYILLGCLRNSLFSVKNNVRATAQRVLPKSIFSLMDHELGLKILLQLHRIKHRQQLKAILDYHDKFILLAPPNKGELAYFVDDYKTEKVFTIPNSIPAIYEGKLAREKIILHVGRLNIPQKRSDLLLSFWQKTHQHLPEWRFIIIGDGPYMGEMEKQIREKEIPRVELLGFQQPESYYKKAFIFMMPSAFEGFPNVILEAQSFGVVPVAFNSYPALPWIVNHEKDALLISAFDTTKMSSEIIKLANSRTKLKAMEQAAKTNASKFTIDEVGKIWLKFFKSLKA